MIGPLIRQHVPVGRPSAQDLILVKPSRSSVRRCLFGSIDHVETRADLNALRRRLATESRTRWNFDFRSMTPIRDDNGATMYEWTRVIVDDVTSERRCVVVTSFERVDVACLTPSSHGAAMHSAISNENYEITTAFDLKLISDDGNDLQIEQSTANVSSRPLSIKLRNISSSTNTAPSTSESCFKCIVSTTPSSGERRKRQRSSTITGNYQ